MTFFAISNGYVDQVPIPEVQRWEAEFQRYMDTAHSEVGRSIAESNDLTEENTAALRSAIEEFQKGFLAS